MRLLVKGQLKVAVKIKKRKNLTMSQFKLLVINLLSKRYKLILLVAQIFGLARKTVSQLWM